MGITADALSQAYATAPAAEGFNARARARALPVAGEITVNDRAAQRQPAALGDAARALFNLPGVVRSTFDSGALSIWGGTDAELRVYLDGVELPLLFHPGGFRSSLPERIVSRLTLIKGAPGPELGRNLGAVIDVETQALDGVPRALLALDTMNASGSVQGTVGPLRVAWAGRLGYLDRLANVLAARARDNLPLPEYADGFAKAQLDLDRDSQLSAAWLGTHDRYVLGDRTLASGSTPRSLTQSRALTLVYLQYKRRYADRARVNITPFVSQYDSTQLGESAGDAWRIGTSALRYGVRANYRAALEQVTVQLGFDAAALRARVARSGTLTLPAREGDISVFGQPPGSEVTSDAWSTHDANVAPYGSLQLRLGRLTISPGIRLSIQLLNSDRALPPAVATPASGRAALRLRPEPRLSLRFFVSEQLQLSARAGFAQQAAAPEDRSALFGNPALEGASGFTGAGGPRLTLRDVLSVEFVGFYRQVWQLSARNPARPMPLAAALVPEGQGHSYGVDLALKLRAWRVLDAQLSYTLSRARRRDHPTVGERFLDFDQTHVFSLLATLRLGAWQLAARARYATGSPRTDVIGSYQNLQGDRFEPIFATHNGARLPDFFALDVRVERTVMLEELQLRLWLDVLNVTNRANVEAAAYSFDLQHRRDLTGLPILAVLGLRAEL